MLVLVTKMSIYAFFLCYLTSTTMLLDLKAWKNDHVHGDHNYCSGTVIRIMVIFDNMLIPPINFAICAYFFCLYD